jgi:tRNA-Thr(GGU) m(6)t(6)A37 methyltransferase TsaA
VNEKYEFEPIGYIESCFKEKFGIPRQPGLVTGAQGIVKLGKNPDLKTALRCLEGFSHLWLIFVFHEHGSRNWKPSIRPPRLGGARKVGVLASRSPHRPNPIGLSVVALEKIDIDAKGGPEIHVRGIDILDGTPILDLKPYIPFADSVPNALAGWAAEPIARTEVILSPEAEAAIEAREGYPQLRTLIIEMLELDPRPAFQSRNLPPSSPAAQGTRHGFRLLEFDVKWEIRNGLFYVVDVVDWVEFA